MPSPKKFQFAKPAKRGRGGDRWLAVVALVGIGLVVWKLSRPAKPAKKSAPTVKVEPPPVKVEVSQVRVTIPAPAPVAASTNRTATEIPRVRGADTNGFTTPLPPETPATARKPRDVFEAQVALAQHGISAGSIDGALGSQTRAALRAFQRREKLTINGSLDAATRAALATEVSPLTSYVVTSNDVARLQPLSKTWLGKSQQSALDFETLLELVAEKAHAHPKEIRLLNPSVNWTNIFAGTSLTVPNAAYPKPTAKAAFVVISLAEKTLEAFDDGTNLLAHFPCSIAAKVEKRPVGELHVVAVAPNPNYTFNPEIFPEVPEARTLTNKLILQPGPNNPVGAVWISLDKSGYGMHGTPKPEDVGRTESHGCFRLANWNAEFLLKLVWVGMPVRVEP
ncbi:MAG: hypothetical protein RL380_402 [Verrucomicrobiota bacterium]